MKYIEILLSFPDKVSILCPPSLIPFLLRFSESFMEEFPALSNPSPTPSAKLRVLPPRISPALVAVLLATSSVVLAIVLPRLHAERISTLTAKITFFIIVFLNWCKYTKIIDLSIVCGIYFSEIDADKPFVTALLLLRFPIR